MKRKKSKKPVAQFGLSPAQYDSAYREQLATVCSAPRVDEQFVRVESTVNGRLEHVYIFTPETLHPADTTPPVKCRLCSRTDPRHNVVAIRRELVHGRLVETCICESCSIQPTNRELILESETERAIRLKKPIRWHRIPDKTPGEWGPSPLRIFHDRCRDRQPIAASRRLQAEKRQSESEQSRGGEGKTTL